MRTLALCSLVLVACAAGQPNTATPAKAPSAEPVVAAVPGAPAIQPSDPNTRVEDWEGMRIVVRRRPHAELVTTELVVRGGVAMAEPATLGAEWLGLYTAASGGSERLPKQGFQSRLARLGSAVEPRVEADGSALEGKSLTAAWPETFDLLTDAFLHPALPASELELQRQRQLHQIRQIEENPDLLLSDLGRRTVFEGTAYAQRALGTTEVVHRLTVEQVRQALERLRGRNRLLLVVVGNVDPDAVISRAKAAFGALPPGSPLPAPVRRPSFTSPRVNAIQRSLPTNYVLAQVPGPSWEDPDFVAGLVSMRILADREFEAIRTKRNLTYAVSAGLVSRQRLPLATLYVTAVDPPTTWRAMQEEVRRLQEEDVEPERLAGAIAELRTRWLMEAESTDGEAQQLAHAELLGGDWRLERRIPDAFPSVTGPQVKQYARHWLKDWQVAVVGDPAKVDLSLFR